ncbi:DUF4190 domain-containing protein [Bremerella sp. T1]|uniref:DUF4190 domain-containing protein n=1 Tax=Bremerella sp. TYQ1 TaxID=3119568 RepID=UPI001CCCBD4F|nr:DUF4190 domain-containing protein [Bremerella volcania]UBM38399.1 DUF4190 domain-containing protein [Bremerella volcania]
MSEGRQNVVIVQGAESNGLGIAGFVLSLLGLITCGLFGPLGFLVSLFGLAYRPRGFAVAGLVLGGLTTGIFAFFGFALLSTLFAAVTGIQFAASEASNSLRMKASNLQIVNEFKEFGAIPSTEKGNDIINENRSKSQPFTGYQRVDEFQYKLTVAGLDRELGTEDDRTEAFDIREQVREYQEFIDLAASDKEQEPSVPTPKPKAKVAPTNAQPEAVAQEPDPPKMPRQIPLLMPSTPTDTDLSEAPTIEDASSKKFNRQPSALTGSIEFDNEPERLWQSIDGKFSTNATLLKFDRDKEEVSLRKQDGTKITVPIKTLSLDDRNYIRRQARQAE